jgi:hypothetical protein
LGVIVLEETINGGKEGSQQYQNKFFFFFFAEYPILACEPSWVRYCTNWEKGCVG